MTSNLPKLKYVELDSIDVSDYIIAFKITEQLDVSFKTAEVILKRTINTLIDYNEKELVGKDVIIKRGVNNAEEDILFRGVVANIQFQGSRVMLGVQDKLSLTKNDTVNTSYDWTTDPEAGVVSEMVKRLLDEHTTLSYSASSIQASGSVNIVKKLVLRHRSVWSALKELSYAIDWQIYYNPNDDLVYFEPSG